MKIDTQDKIKAWIKHYAKQHYTDAYSTYIANHTRVTMESTIKLET